MKGLNARFFLGFAYDCDLDVFAQFNGSGGQLDACCGVLVGEYLAVIFEIACDESGDFVYGICHKISVSFLCDGLVGRMRNWAQSLF